MAKKNDDQTTATDEAGADENISPAADAVNQESLAVSGMPTGGTDETLDARDPNTYEAVPDPKDNPYGPDDVSAVADPDDPTKIIDPGADPDLQ